MTEVNNEIKDKFQQAENLRFSNKFEEAIRIYKEIVEKIPDFNPALHNIAVCYTSLNKLDEAEKYYIKCLKLKGIHFQTLNNLAKIYLEKKEFKRALPLLQNSLSKIPNQEKVAESIAECLFYLNLFNDLNVFIEQALKKFPSNKVFQIFYGKNLLKMGKYKKGLKVLKDTTGVIEFDDEKFSLV